MQTTAQPPRGCETPRPRADWIDAARGIGIVLVVLGHMVAPPNTYLHAYQFHMPLFFVLGGVVARRTTAGTSPATLLRPLIGAEVWLIGLTAYATAYAGLFDVNYLAGDPTSLAFYTTDIATQNFQQNALMMVGWFVTAYSLARIVGYCVARILQSTAADDRASVITLCTLAALAFTFGTVWAAPRFASTQWWPFNLAAQALVGSSFYLTGMALARSRRALEIAQRPWTAGCALAVAVLLQWTFTPSAMVMAWSRYPNHPLLQIALTGSLLIATFGLAVAIQGWRLAKLFGEASKTIMFGHILVFSLVNALFIAVGVLDPKTVTATTTYRSDALWPLYTVFGLTLPAAVDYGLRAARRRRAMRIVARASEQSRYR